MSQQNWVAKHDFNRAAVHKDKKKHEQESNRKQKHKGQKNDYHQSY